MINPKLVSIESKLNLMNISEGVSIVNTFKTAPIQNR